MNKEFYIGFGSVLGLTLLVILVLLTFSSPKNNATATDSKSINPADKIEVLHFHATQQCWSCTTVGKYALKTIQEKFPEEYKNGIIVFKDVNGELPENKELVMKYRAGGSSLFINAISNGVDNIEEDVTVWRLVSNEQQFLNYFETKLKKLLGQE
jgi:hypothetical protein